MRPKYMYMVFFLLSAWASTLAWAELSTALPGVSTRPGDAALLRCALIVDSAMNPDRLGLASMMEVKLGELKQITMLDRAEINKVIREQKISLLFDPEATAKRVAVGKMLKADLLVFLQDRKLPQAASKTQQDSQQEEDKQGVDLAVAETTRGLRLVMSTDIWNPEKVEAIADGFIKQVQRACNLMQQPELKVFAVPSFECKDILPQYASKRRAFARLIEEFLVGTPGVVVAELSEAQALSREMAIGVTSIVRDLPYYLIGTYKSNHKNNETNGDVTFDLSIDLCQGQTSLKTIERSAVSQEQLGQTIKTTIRDLLPKAGSKPTSEEGCDEIELLLRRAGMFRRLIEWDEAIPLYESVLLLDPNNIKAHRKLLEGYWYMVQSRTNKDPSKPPGYDPASRVYFGKKAFSHGIFLLRKRKLSDDLLITIDQKAHFHITGYENDPEYDALQAEIESIVKRLADEVWKVLKDPDLKKYIPRERYNGAFFRMARVILWANLLNPPEERLMRDYELLVQLEKAGAPLWVLVRTYNVRSYTLSELIDKLEKHSSRRLQKMVDLLRLVNQAVDQATYNQAVEEVKQYLLAEEIKQDLLTPLESVARFLMTSRIRAKEALSRTDDTNVFLPQLIPLNDRITYTPTDAISATSMPRILDWMTCRPGLEILAFSSGLYRLGEGDTLEFLAPVIPCVPRYEMQDILYWDGRFLWVRTNDPKGAIVVVDPERGEIARFDEVEVVQDGDLKHSHLACLKPGQTLFFGCYEKPPASRRTWAVLLEVDLREDGTVAKRFDRFYEARKKRFKITDLKSPPDIYSAGYPNWIITVPVEVEPTGPWVMVHWWSQPLILDIPRRQARLAKAKWPLDSPLYINSGFLTPCGELNSTTQVSSVQWSDHPDHEPRVVIDWGERQYSGIGTPWYFTSAAMYQGWLHILCNSFGEGSPAWVAVDPKTWDSRIIADYFPEKYPRGFHELLRFSERYGLIYMRGNNERPYSVYMVAYQVKLPPVELWPKMETVDIPASQPAE